MDEIWTALESIAVYAYVETSSDGYEVLTPDGWVRIRTADDARRVLALLRTANATDDWS